MRIILPSQEFEVPDGDRCIHWDGSNISCQFFHQDTVHISNGDAQHSGLGFGGGSITHYSCKLFRRGLGEYRYGYGVSKPNWCVNETSTYN